MSKFKKIVSALLLTFVGTAIWEWLLDPFFMFLYNQTIPSIIHHFNDSFYQKVAFSTPEAVTHNMFMMLIVFFFLIPLKYIIGLFNDETVLHIRIICSVILYLFFMSNIFAHQTAKRTLRNIEIVAPYISDIEYKTLKSDFYRIDSKEDYISLTNQIEKLMNKYDLSE